MSVCDLIIRGGMLFDGSDAPAIRADLAIDRDRIVAVGDVSEWSSDAVIDASGLAVAPGFIDVHTHDDWAVLKTPDMPFKVTQGVTTIIGGNCGISAAPLRPEHPLPPPFTTQHLSEGDLYHDVATYAEAVKSACPAVNIGLLVGHSSLRVGVMGDDLDRAATPGECQEMASMLNDALSQGAIGFSSGLDYPPALEAPIEEMIALARVLRGHDRSIYTSHIRDEGDYVVEAVREAIETGRQSGASLVISHHKCAGTNNFGKSEQTLAEIDTARISQDVGLDVYPYVASSSSLLKRYLRDANDIKIIWSTSYPSMGGRMLNDIADEWGISRSDAVDKLHPAGAIYFDMSEDDLRRIMSHPGTMIASDGIPGTEKPHPRLWGTFPRALGHYARDQQLMSMSTAVHKMTGLPAKTFNLVDRGVLSVGAIADVVVFDPETVIDRATFDDPEQASTGICHVLVGGVPVLANTEMTGQRSGQFLGRS